MHDPDTVAFEIPRPWPRRERSHDAYNPWRAAPGPRWRFRLHHDCTPDCDRDHPAQPFPWWRPRSWTPFWVIAGRGFYWPPIVVVWHREPDGHDSGTVCRTHWRFHVHHWRLQFPPLQALRRSLLTRCAWCGGRSRKGDLVNVSHQWNGARGPWWRGEQGLYHHDCSSVEHAHRSCACDDPLVERGGGFGKCLLCGRYAAGTLSESMRERRRLLASVPQGRRDPVLWARVVELADRERVVTSG